MDKYYLEDLKAFLELPKELQEVIWLDLIKENVSYKDLTNFFFYSLKECESPIEKIFFYYALRYSLNKYSDYNIYFCSQTEIEANGNDYRVDFYLQCENWDKDKHLPGNLGGDVIIECDGHDFHEKTKEQVIRGNKRDYDLKMEGYEIIHFSGSEIYNEPKECAMKAIDYLIKHLQAR